MFAVLLSAIIGIFLGLLGGGGSILIIPMLVYLLQFDPKDAIVTSFIVVGLSSLVSLIPHARRASVCWKSGAVFGVTGMLSAYAGGRMGSHFDSSNLMLLFGLVTLLAGSVMLIKRPSSIKALEDQYPVQICPLRLPFFFLLISGSLVGFITGLVGVGGGFMIVPALILVVGLPIQGAIGTSLLVITLNSAAGLMGYSQEFQLNVSMTAMITIATVAGSLLGGLLSSYVSPAQLKNVFGYLVIAVAGYTLYQSLIWNENTLLLSIRALGLILFWVVCLIAIAKSYQLVFDDEALCTNDNAFKSL
jgi:uncharacterized protein